MSNALMLDVGQAEKLKLAFRRNGWTNVKIDKLCEGEFLKRVLEVIDGLAEIKAVRHVINLDADPFVPINWKVEEHQKGGTFEWNPASVELYLSPLQTQGKAIGGIPLRNELKGKSVLNACLLDYLLAHPYLIPDTWKGKRIFFWGTIYRSSGGLCVRCLYWDDDSWQWGRGWLNVGWSDDEPAALRASA